MKFVAYSVIQKEVMFTLEDCPHVSSDGIITLLAKENSPLIDSRTVMRVFPTFTEGDVVEVDNDSGIVFYDKGIMLKTKDGIKKIKEEKHIKVRNRRIETVTEIANIQRTRILFVYNNMLYGFDDFLCSTGSYLCIVGNRRKIPVKDLLPFTGYVIGNRPIGFGSSFQGGIVVLHDGEPYIKYPNNNFKSLKEELKNDAQGIDC